MTQLLMFLTKDPRSFGERASEAGIVSLQGMLTIFAVLALLWGAVELFRVALSAANRNKTKKAQSNVPAVEPDSKPAEVITTEADDGALIAAITAAIHAARADEGVTTGFRVVSFRRTAR